MNNKPIGIFDSGIGGLTVAKEIAKSCPDEQMIYFGDTAHLPYGNKSNETVKRLSRNNTDFLISHGVKLLVVACNSATASALDDIIDSVDIPVIGVIKPGVKEALRVTRSGRIGIIGTTRTVASESYIDAVKEINSSIYVVQKSCPLFVPLIEENWINHQATILIIKEYLDKFISENKLDTVILGCTHYPLLKSRIQEVYPDITLVDSAESIARKVKETLQDTGLENTAEIRKEHEFYVSDITEHFAELAQRIMNIKKLELKLQPMEIL